MTNKINNPKVSVIIPTHNRAILVDRAINSVLAQTYRDFELIIVDDGSTDNTEKVVKSFKDTRIRFFRHEHNEGAPAARNTGIKMARGEYVTFLDSDDEYAPEKLQEQVSLFKTNSDAKLGVVVTGLMRINDFPKNSGVKTEILLSPCPSGYIYDVFFLLGGKYPTEIASMMVKREYLLKEGMFDEELSASQFWDMGARLAKKYEFHTIEKPLYIVHEDAETRIWNKNNRIKAIDHILVKYAQELTRRPKTAARLQLILGVLSQKSGFHWKGTQAIVRSWRLHPYSPSVYKQLLYCLLPAEGIFSRHTISASVNAIAKILKSIAKGFFIGFTVGECLLSGILKNTKHPTLDPAKHNIIIVGPVLSNRGDQAMLFTAVDQIKRRFPNINIQHLSTSDYLELGTDNFGYTFNILPWDRDMIYRFCGHIGTLLFHNNFSSSVEAKIKHVFQDAFCIVNLSGYALSSQWGFSNSFGFILNLMLAKKYSIPTLIFPQSIGPFNYPLLQKAILFPLMKLYLKYPEVIYLREGEDASHLYQFTKINVEHRPDIVIQRGEYDLSHIFTTVETNKLAPIKKPAVGIFPSERVSERVDRRKLLNLYVQIIESLLDSGKLVYILRHSKEDLFICGNIASYYSGDDRVTLLRDAMDAIQLETIIKSFDFVIASRYHSIIHSFRNNIPALVIGWAPKYVALLQMFHQTQYLFDCRASIEEDKILASLKTMLRSFPEERMVLAESMQEIQKKDAFSFFDRFLADT